MAEIFFYCNNRMLFSYNNITRQILNNSVYDLAGEAAHIIKPWGKLVIKAEPLWEYDCGEAYAMVRCNNAIVLSAKRQTNLVEVLDINNGKRLWSHCIDTFSAPLGTDCRP